MSLGLMKSEPDWNPGVSEAVAKAGLYTDHQVKDELVRPDLLQPADVIHSIKASSALHSNLQSLKPCSVKLVRIPFESNLGISSGDVSLQTLSMEEHITSTYDRIENLQSIVKPCSVRLLRMDSSIPTDTCIQSSCSSKAPDSSHDTVNSEKTDLYSIKDTLDTVSSNETDPDARSNGRYCSVMLERLILNTKPRTSEKEQRMIKLWEGGGFQNVYLTEDIAVMNIIKQSERQYRSSVKKSADKVAQKPTYESTINAREFPKNSRSPVLNKVEKHSFLISKHSPEANKTKTFASQYICDNCGESFKNKSKLKIHVLNFLLGHSCGRVDRKRYQCYCGYQSNTKNTFVVHQMRHTGEKPYKCSDCSYECVANYMLLIHKTIHTREIRYECDHCSYKTHNKINIASHMKIHTIGKQFKCDQCDYATQYKCALNVHRRTHTGEKPYACSFCDYKCRQSADLRSHERRHTGYKPFKCIHCVYRCGTKDGLQRHMRTHTGEKPYKCSFCDFKCSRKGHLKVHERRHTGEKPFKCSYCDYACNQKPNLIMHERVHTGQKPFKCKSCPYRTAQRTHLTTHLKIHTGEKPFKCSKCDYACCDKSRLTSHSRKHSHEKPYKCSLCDYKCRSKSGLKVHQRVHTGEKPYKCTLCDYSCPYRESLGRHMKKHHGKS